MAWIRSRTAKADGISEDDQKFWEDPRFQDLTDTYIKKVDEALETKQSEIMQV